MAEKFNAELFSGSIQGKIDIGNRLAFRLFFGMEQ